MANKPKIDLSERTTEEWLESFELRDQEFAAIKASQPDTHFGEFYARRASERVAKGKSHATLGANLKKHDDWAEAGRRPFERYKKAHGITPEFRVVDYGCGSLRVGSHFIRYLEPGHYFGLDIIPDFYEIGQDLLGEKIVADKAPEFGEIRKPESIARAVAHNPNFVYSSAVSYHVHPDDMDEYFGNLSKIAHKPDCIIYMDATLSEKHFRYRQRSWSWPLEFYEKMLPGFETVDVVKGQKRVELGQDFSKALLTFRRAS